MANRKETPDVLSEILGGEPAAPRPAPEAKPKSPPRRRAPTARSSRPSKPKRQIWEYQEVIFHDYGGFRPRYVNGEELADWKDGPTIHQYLNQLGADGWELAGLGSENKREMPAYLKRLKS